MHSLALSQRIARLALGASVTSSDITATVTAPDDDAAIAAVIDKLDASELLQFSELLAKVTGKPIDEKGDAESRDLIERGKLQ
jgi:hypothetical protein